MSDISIRLATRDDGDAIVTMLSHLVDEIGSKDHFFTTPEAIIQYGFGEKPLFQCLVAGREQPDLGLILFFPIFSTNRGKPGIYVQDLWISRKARGEGLGRRMLTKVINHGSTQWDASYLSLTVYPDNLKAMEFYRKLGFDTHEHDVPMALDGDAFAQLRSGS